MMSNFLTTKALQKLKMGCFILLSLITLQSAFAVTETGSINLSNDIFNKQKLKNNVIASQTMRSLASKESLVEKSVIISIKTFAKKTVKEQNITHEECLDCDCKCCPCCSNIMFFLTLVNKDIKASEQSYFIFELLQSPALYSSLKRPPKQLDHYII